MENPTHSFEETNLMLQLKGQLQIKSKTVAWSLQKKKDGIFSSFYFVRTNFFNICILSQCIVY